MPATLARPLVSARGMASTDPPVKRSRTSTVESLQALLNVGGISRDGLYKLLKKLEEVPELPSHCMNLLNTAYHERFRRVRIMMPLELDSGEIFEWELADPTLLLQMVIDVCPSLGSLYKAALRGHPGRWDIVFVWDEFSPGNQMAIDNKRKVMNASFNFTQLGMAVLSSEASWLTPISVRHNVVARAKVGWSGMLAMFLKHFLFGPQGVCSAGIPLVVDGETIVVMADLKHMLSDGDGIKMAFNWKGAGGTKPCLLHHNVFARGSDLACRAPGCVEISEDDPNLFKTWAGTGLEDVVDLISAAHEKWLRKEWSKERFKDLQQIHGINFSVGGLLNDRELRSRVRFVDTIRYDWMHSTLQDGSVSTEIYLFFEACKSKLGISNKDVETFLKLGWSFPAAHSAKGKQLWHVFDDFRTRSSAKAGHLKASASELLGVFSLLRHFADTRVATRPEVAAEYAALQAAFDVVDLFMCAKKGRISTREAGCRLYRAVAYHLKKHKEIHGTSEITPKFHWLFDICEQVSKSPVLLDCFIVERLHLRVKQIANPIKNTKVFEASVLAGVINSHIQALEAKEFGNRLVGKVLPYPGLLQTFVADKMQQNSQKIAVGDFVFHGASVGKVIACVLEGHNLSCLVDVWSCICQVSTYGHRWAQGGEVGHWPADAVDCAVAWRPDGDGVLVLRL